MADPDTRLAAIRDGIARACRAARRDPADVTLVAVAKTRPVAKIVDLLDLGLRDFGESRVQEAADKWPALRQRYPDARLHLIGRLQSNKADEAAALFDVIHSLDRESLLDALVQAGTKANRFLPCYVQVNIGEEDQKGGVAIAALPTLLELVRASPLPLAGLMAIPPAGVEAAPYFALLAEQARRHDVTGLSMGMSSDYASAVMLGATVVRVGSALFDDA